MRPVSDQGAYTRASGSFVEVGDRGGCSVRRRLSFENPLAVNPARRGRSVDWVTKRDAAVADRRCRHWEEEEQAVGAPFQVASMARRDDGVQVIKPRNRSRQEIGKSWYERVAGILLLLADGDASKREGDRHDEGERAGYRDAEECERCSFLGGEMRAASLPGKDSLLRWRTQASLRQRTFVMHGQYVETFPRALHYALARTDCRPRRAEHSQLVAAERSL